MLMLGEICEQNADFPTDKRKLRCYFDSWGANNDDEATLSLCAYRWLCLPHTWGNRAHVRLSSFLSWLGKLASRHYKTKFWGWKIQLKIALNFIFIILYEVFISERYSLDLLAKKIWPKSQIKKKRMERVVKRQQTFGCMQRWFCK